MISLSVWNSAGVSNMAINRASRLTPYLKNNLSVGKCFIVPNTWNVLHEVGLTNFRTTFSDLRLYIRSLNCWKVSQ